MERREADALLRFRNLTGTQKSAKDGNLTGTISASEGMNINITVETCEEDRLTYTSHVSKNSSSDMTDKIAVHKESTDDTRISHVNDKIGLTEVQDLGHSYGGDCTDTAIIDDRDRHRSNEISGGIIEIGTDLEVDAVQNDDSENRTAKESYLSSQRDNNAHTGTGAIDGTGLRTGIIDDTGPVVHKHNDSDEFLNISDGASHKSLLTSSFEDVDNQDRANAGEDVSASDKSSSYANISANSDIDSVYSAISYDNDDGNPRNLRKDSENDSSGDTEILELSNEMDHNISTENLEAESNANESDNPKTLEERLELIHGANLSFTSNIAALAAAKSRAFGLVQESSYGGETFGDLSDSEEDSSAQ